VSRVGVIFDVDGLLIDTEPVWRAAERAVFGDLGLTLTDAELASTMGVRIEEVVAHWRQQRPWPDNGETDAAVAARVVARVVGHIQRQGEAQPGVAEAFAAAAEAGSVALASSSPPRLIDAVCDRLRLDVTVRCSAVDEARGKPAPDVYLRAARRLGIEPARCVALEDSPNGVRSARAAGMACIAIPDPMVAADPLFAETTVLRSLAEVTGELLRRLAGEPTLI
jgi:HAD superfamily hydrolase (TIGR01509 family)